MTPESALTLAITRFDLKGFVDEHGGRRAGSREFTLTCPVCAKEKLSVSLTTRRWHCFICEQYVVGANGKKRALKGAGGVFALVQLIGGLTKRETALKLLRDTGNAPPDGTDFLPAIDLDAIDGGTAESTARVPTGLPDACVAVDRVLPYMARRGISLRDAQEFGLGWCPSGKYANRLIFPVWMNGQCHYWQGRAMWDESEHVPRDERDRFRKTMNPPRFACLIHGKFPDDVEHACPWCGAPPLYGSGDVLLNVQQAATYPRVAITEGPTSCIRVGPSAVATFGKQLQAQQVALLIAHGVKAVDFMWDGPTPKEPEGAWAQMGVAAAALAPFMDVRIVYFPRGDPGDYTREQNAWFRTQALPYGNTPTDLL